MGPGTTTPEPSTESVRAALSHYAVSNTRQGLILFVFDLSIYVASIAGVLFAPWLFLKILLSLLAGFKLANLVTIAHDAAHNSLTASRRLNKIIAVISFTPCLFSYPLWIYDHHYLHHRRTNETHPDSYTPLSKQEYDALPAWRRLKVRLYRAPTLWFFGLYYIVERWAQVKFVPTRAHPARIRRAAAPYSLSLIIYFAAFIGLLASAPSYSNTSTLSAILLGFVLPFYIFQSLYAFTVYVQHTHPRIPWFRNKPRDSVIARQDFISVHMRLPYGLAWLSHFVYDHAAHHVHPGIPCYRLHDAQIALNELIGQHAVTERFSLRWLYNIQRICKLYDYAHYRWLDFDGHPTSDKITQTPAKSRPDYDAT